MIPPWPGDLPAVFCETYRLLAFGFRLGKKAKNSVFLQKKKSYNETSTCFLDFEVNYLIFLGSSVGDNLLKMTVSLRLKIEKFVLQIENDINFDSLFRLDQI